MNIVWFPHVINEKVSSYRIRCKKIAEYLQQQGHNVAISDLNKHAPIKQDADIVIFSKVAGYIAEEVLRQYRDRTKARIVLDLCDNKFYTQYPQHNYTFGDWFSMSKKADLRITCSSIFAEMFKGYTEEKWEWIPDMYEFTDEYTAIFTNAPRRILWHGSAQNSNVRFGCNWKDPIIFKGKIQDNDKTLVLITGLKDISADQIWLWYKREGLSNIEVHDYDINTFVYIARSCDMEIIPVYINPFTWGKSANRLIANIALGIKTEYTHIPAYREFDNMNIIEARQIVRAKYNPEIIGSQWEELLLNIAK